MDEGHILMEYIGSEKNIIPLSQSYTEDQLVQVVDQVALLQAYALKIKYEERYGPIGRMMRGDEMGEEEKEEHRVRNEKVLEKIEEYGGGKRIDRRLIGCLMNV
jgi:hypothetical protein